MTDNEFWEILGQQPDERMAEWVDWGKAVIESAALSDSSSPSLDREKAPEYLCRILWLFENFRDPDHLTVEENILLAAFAGGAVLSGLSPGSRNVPFLFGQALNECKASGWVLSEEYDEWQPGMVSGTGYKTYIRLQIAGRELAKSSYEQIRQIASKECREQDEVHEKKPYPKIVFKSLRTMETVDIPPGFNRLSCLADAGLREIWYFRGDYGLAELDYRSAFVMFRKTIERLVSIADDGWSLLPKYRKALTEVSRSAQKCCGVSGTSGHEVALRLIDRICVEVGGCSTISILDDRGSWLSRKEFKRFYYDMVSEKEISDGDYVEGIFNRARKRTEFVDLAEIDWLQKQLEVEHVAAQKLLGEKDRSAQENSTAPVKSEGCSRASAMIYAAF